MKILQRRLVRVAAAAVAVVGWGAVIVAPTGASAALVTFSYQGTVNFVDSPLASQFSIGDPFTTMFTFEQTTMDTNANSTVGFYPAITSFTVDIDGYIVSGTAGSILVINGSASDAFNVTLGGTVVGSPVNGNSPIAASVNLTDLTHSVFSNDFLPGTRPDPTFFLPAQSSLSLAFSSCDPICPVVRAQFSEHLLAPVPLPAALPLFLSALAGLGLMGWRRRQADA